MSTPPPPPSQAVGIIDLHDSTTVSASWRARTARRGSALPALLGSICLPDNIAEYDSSLTLPGADTSTVAGASSTTNENYIRRPSFIPPRRPSADLFGGSPSTTQGDGSSPSEDTLVEDVLESREIFAIAVFEHCEAAARNELMEDFIETLPCLTSPIGRNYSSVDELFARMNKVIHEDDNRPISAFVRTRPGTLKSKGSSFLIKEVISMTQNINNETFQVAELNGRYFVLQEILLALMDQIVLKSFAQVVRLGVTSRKRPYHLNTREQLQKDAEKAQAALKIQSLQRQRAARKELQDLRRKKGALEEEERKATEEAQKADDAANALQTSKSAETSEDQAAIKIQTLQRQRDAKKRVEELRKQKQALEQQEKDQIAQQAKAEAEEKKQQEEHLKLSQDQAAVKIQSLQRQRAARKKLEGLRREKIQLEAEERNAKDEEEKANAAAAKADEDEKKNPSKELTEDQAALKIQTVQRQREAKKRVEELKKKKAELAERELAAKQEHEQAAVQGVGSDEAPVVVQQQLSSHKQEKLDQETAALKIQSAQRQKAARAELAVLKQAEEDKKLKQQQQQQQEDAEKHAAELAKQQQQTQRDKSDRENTAAVKIQSAQRQKVARKEVSNRRERKLVREEEEKHQREVQEHESKLHADAEHLQRQKEQQEKNEQELVVREERERRAKEEADKNRVLTYEEIQELATKHVQQQQEEREREALRQQQEQKQLEEEERQRKEQEVKQQQRAAQQNVKKLDNIISSNDRSVITDTYVQQQKRDDVESEKQRKRQQEQELREQEERMRYIEAQIERKKKQQEEEAKQAEIERQRYERLAKLDAMDFNPFADVHEEKKKLRQERLDRQKRDAEETRAALVEAKRKQREAALKRRANLDEISDDDIPATPSRQLSSACSPRANIIRGVVMTNNNNNNNNCSTISRTLPLPSLTARSALTKTSTTANSSIITSADPKKVLSVLTKLAETASGASSPANSSPNKQLDRSVVLASINDQQQNSPSRNLLRSNFGPDDFGEIGPSTRKTLIPSPPSSSNQNAQTARSKPTTTEIPKFDKPKSKGLLMPLSMDSDEVFKTERKNVTCLEVSDASHDRNQRLRELRRQNEEVQKQLAGTTV